MSELLNSGRFGILDKDRISNHYIFNRWDEYGFLEGLDKEVAMKVALSYEITSHFL